MARLGLFSALERPLFVLLLVVTFASAFADAYNMSGLSPNPIKFKLPSGITKIRDFLDDVLERDRDTYNGDVSAANQWGQAIVSGCSTTCGGQKKKWQCGVMHEPINVYLIWFGRFKESQKNIIRNFVRSLSDTSDPANTVSQWWNINRLYTDCNGNPVSGTVRLAGDRHLKPRMRFLFSNMAISYIVNRAISAKAFPADSNGVYFVITDKGTTQKSLLGGFCSAYCGWHSFDTIKGKALKVSFVGHPGRCLKSCASPTISRKGGVSPNGDRAMDAMVSILAHELAEAASDPYLGTWTDASGMENADICAWSYGSVETTDSGADYNLVGRDGMKFLVQQNYHPTQRTCLATTTV
ncbi:hypothetical protein CLOM_g13171 [Closterium sp. NIES-68]|nr:hypothetical protein CLOM_g13171 [Closterium sp. NIES-68]GJP61564.1 hypothetical protein CLOP_g18708 [Closterium sp. NIES-67]